MILQSSWESTLLVAGYGLTNGGTAGTIWMTVFVVTGVMCMICSMAEMASMAPTAGGQYHWVSEFAPPSVQKPLSYIVGKSRRLPFLPRVLNRSRMVLLSRLGDRQSRRRSTHVNHDSRSRPSQE